jgi:hypothetical protein
VHGSKFDAEVDGGFMIGHAAQLTINRYRRAADKLKLTNTPAGRPDRHGRGDYLQLFATVIVKPAVQRVTVDSGSMASAWKRAFLVRSL